ncbi:MAG: hypothetical protein HY226_01315 [Candidatus Vogelbacteria bacterium]|nr:hypothetical protein [Candidatus Vogelbacteria bacterium]
MFFAAFLFALLNFIFKLDKLAIKQVFISGNKNIETGLIYDVTKENLSGNYYYMFPKNNILIYPRDEIENSLKKNFMRIKYVDIASVLGNLSLSISEREPAYLWCDDADKDAIDRICYYLDEDGFTFAIAPQFSGDVYLSFYGGNKRGGYMGRSVLETASFHSIVDIKNYFLKAITSEHIQLGVLSGIYIYKNGDFDLLFGNGNSKWRLSINLPEGDSINSQSENSLESKLFAILNSQVFKDELNHANNKLEYIDLRFGKKVFYKFSHIGYIGTK